jgi:hypothetical protein
VLATPPSCRCSRRSVTGALLLVGSEARHPRDRHRQLRKPRRTWARLSACRRLSRGTRAHATDLGRLAGIGGIAQYSGANQLESLVNAAPPRGTSAQRRPSGVWTSDEATVTNQPRFTRSRSQSPRRVRRSRPGAPRANATGSRSARRRRAARRRGNDQRSAEKLAQAIVRATPERLGSRRQLGETAKRPPPGLAGRDRLRLSVASVTRKAAKFACAREQISGSVKRGA